MTRKYLSKIASAVLISAARLCAGLLLMAPLIRRCRRIQMSSHGPAQRAPGWLTSPLSQHGFGLLFTVALAACGGGGGGAGETGGAPSGGSSTPSSIPVVSVSLSQPSVALGTAATLTWSASNASACVASGAWIGSQAISGSASVLPSSTGNHIYTLACSGAGGDGSSSASLRVAKLSASSYENKTAIGAPPTALPENFVNAFAVADFFGDGAQSLVTHTLEYNPANPATYSKLGHIHFYKNINGAWVDKTSAILGDAVGCLHPRKAIVSDFNKDGRPDIFFACTGLDTSPFPGEHPHMLLSQSNGTYVNVTLSTSCYCHSASAADINADGYPDVLVTDTSVAHTPYFLINDQHGSFTSDFSRLPLSVSNKQIYTAELIDTQGSGKYDVFLGGNEPGTSPDRFSEFTPTVFPNDGSGGFISTTPISLYTSSFGLPLDIVVQNGNAYLLKVNHNYTAVTIVKVAYPSNVESVIYSHSGPYPVGGSWIDWLLPYGGRIVSQNAAFGVTLPF